MDRSVCGRESPLRLEPPLNRPRGAQPRKDRCPLRVPCLAVSRHGGGAACRWRRRGCGRGRRHKRGCGCGGKRRRVRSSGRPRAHGRGRTRHPGHRPRWRGRPLAKQSLFGASQQRRAALRRSGALGRDDHPVAVPQQRPAIGDGPVSHIKSARGSRDLHPQRRQRIVERLKGAPLRTDGCGELR